MFDNSEQFITIMSKYKITANQFLLCYLLYTDEKVKGRFPVKDAEKPMANLYKYSFSTPWTHREIEDLMQKGLLINKSRINTQTGKQEMDADMMQLSSSFTAEIFASWDAFDQLVELYPNFLELSNGVKFKTKACDLEKLEEYYKKTVKSKAAHERIIELTLWGKNHKQLDTNFENYVKGRGWLALQELEKIYGNAIDNMHTP